ncbi:hypothetical protein [Paenibacillus taiwanensis]|uniref:hypothetical protein n=1 Tax=Paenibacillus taiwanensis TaxID=401638 RepID=UPI0004901706|nr:hypothetical protein [Paenibacillus taiwanensis]
MNRQLLQETNQLLMQELPAQTGIHLNAGADEPILLDMAEVLVGYDMEQQDRRVLLGCYWLLLQSIRSHDHLPTHPDHVGRGVLDGDFLQSFYLQFALRHGFVDLIADLAKTMKLVQIRRAEGSRTIETQLHQRLCRFVSKRYLRRYKSTQRFKQVTYDVI